MDSAGVSRDGAWSALLDRPVWRGRLHVWAFAITFPAGFLLILPADRPAARAAASVYVASLLLVFGTSAAYHRLARSPRARATMQRLDHSMIYVLIAGSYVPLCVLALPAAWGIPVLSVVVAGAVFGMVIKLVASRQGRLHTVGDVLYPVLGWCAIAAAPALASRLSATQIALLVGGGIAYTVGFPVLLKHRPDPWPRTFGYHEVWHTCTVVAAGMHFAAVASVVL